MNKNLYKEFFGLKENSIKEEKNVLSICNMPKSEMKKVSEYLYGTAY